MSMSVTVRNSWAEQYSKNNGVAVTFVSNTDLSEPAFRARLKEFHFRVDQSRFGRKFYLRPFGDRLDFLVAPEGFDRANPHYHGFLAVPLVGRGHGPDVPLSAVFERYAAIWGAVVPAGSVQFKELSDPSGWAAYSSKESSLSDDRSVWSQTAFVPRRD